MSMRVYNQFLFLCILLVLLGLFSSNKVGGFRFDLKVNSERCFTSEIPSNTDVKITYAATDAYAQFLDAVLTDSKGTVLWSEIGKSRSSHSQHIMTGGDYKLCFTSRQAGRIKSGAGITRSVLLNYKFGSDAIDYSSVATKEKLKPIEVQVRSLEDVVREINTECSFFKEKEREMRDTTESMTAKVMWLSILLIIVFVILTSWQLLYLRHYFRKKRMID